MTVIPEGTIPKKRKWRGLSIDVENPAGTTRQGVGPNGVPWSTTMLYDYGYIRKTEGADGDDVDVFVGPDPDAQDVYVIHQRKAPTFAVYDEDKCMLDFPSEADAKKAYEAHYDRPDFFGTMEKFPVADFEEHVKKYRKAPGHVSDNYLTPSQLWQRCMQAFGGA